MTKGSLMKVESIAECSPSRPLDKISKANPTHLYTMNPLFRNPASDPGVFYESNQITCTFL